MPPLTEQFSGFITLTTLVVSNWVGAGGAINKFNLVANREELRLVTNVVETFDYYDGFNYQQINNVKHLTNFDILLDVRYKSISGSLINIDAFWSGDMINVFPSNPPVLYPYNQSQLVPNRQVISLTSSNKNWWTSNAWSLQQRMARAKTNKPPALPFK